MKKLYILFISAMVILVAGCAQEEQVSTFYEMGCGSSFSDIFLTKGTTVSNTYPLEVKMGLNCNDNVSVLIKFYDNGYNGHYKYFLVNGKANSYSDTIHTDYEGIGTGLYSFTTDDNLYTPGTYYGIYEVNAKNLDTLEYTIQKFRIEAYDYHISSNKEPAVSSYKAKPVPKVDYMVESDNNSLLDNNIDNISINE